MTGQFSSDSIFHMKAADAIAAKFIEAIKTTQVLPWQKQFVSLSPCNAATKKAYRGLNVLACSFMGNDNEFLTFRQAKEAGGSVKKGAKGIPICFWSKIEKKNQPQNRPFWLLRYYTVFNLNDVEGVKIARREIPNKNHTPDEIAEKIRLAAGVPVQHGGNQPAYFPGLHQISMPAPEQFKTSANYYKTLFHEITHGMAKVCGVELKGASSDYDAYGKEELVAELGANLLLQHCGISVAGLFDNSQAYFQGWLNNIQGDSSLLISAASQAQKRFDYIMARLNPSTEVAQPGDAEDSTDEA